jgi:hypothetical protein
MRLNDPAQVTAFNTSYFLHGFMRDFMTKRQHLLPASTR